MGISLGPLLANITMTELEQNVVKTFTDIEILQFYGRFVDDTLVVIKPEHLDLVHNALNSFVKNLRFTIGTFDDAVPQTLDIVIDPDGLGKYCKPTNTG